jgi:hypothetical protein
LRYRFDEIIICASLPYAPTSYSKARRETMALVGYGG